MQIQKLGLEIRKIGSLSGLYRDIDQVLKSHKILSGEINATVQVNATAHALQRMLSTTKYCDITTINECADLCQIVISKERLKVYRTMHCVHWNEMTDEFRQMLVAMILDDFRCVLNPVEIDAIQ